MSNSDVSICNRALSLAGEKLITSFDDSQNEAVVAKAMYGDILAEVLEEGWSFNTERSTLLPDVSPTKFGGLNKFRLNNNVLRVMWATGDESTNPDIDKNMLYYTIEGRYILADADKLFVKLSVKSEDPSKWSASFKTALVYRLASDFALSLSESRAKSNDFMNRYIGFLSSASANDGSQGTSQKIRSSRLIDVRG